MRTFLLTFVHSAAFVASTHRICDCPRDVGLASTRQILYSDLFFNEFSRRFGLLV